MRTRLGDAGGQSLLETALLLPLLLILLAGGYWSFRNLSLSNASESASHALLLRTGRDLPQIKARLSKTIHPAGSNVLLQGGNDRMAARLPLFGGMAGNTVASASVSCPKGQAGGFLDLPAHRVRCEAEGAVDCWGSGTGSGSTIRGTVRGILLTGVFR